jgi:ketosteroid isomerase-like protein
LEEATDLRRSSRRSVSPQEESTLKPAASPIVSRRTAVRLGTGGIAAALAGRVVTAAAAQAATSIEENKAIVRRFFEEAVNRTNLSVFDELFAPDFVDRTPFPGQAPGPAGIEESAGGLLAMFSALRVTVEAVIAEGDLVAAHVTWRGTDARTSQGVTGTTLHIWRLAGGQFLETWSAGWEWLAQVETGQTGPTAGT